MPTVKTRKPKPAAPVPTGRPVLYPEIALGLCAEADALTVEQAKEILGWEAEQPGEKFQDDYLFKDREGRKIRCHNNIKNRPLYTSVCETYVQEILRKRWRINGEPLIIGLTGMVLNGQHRLVALILADQDRVGKQKHFWADVWGDNPCTIDTVIVYGISEDDTTINTMDTCKPRSLADVIYRSEYFHKLGSSDRKKAGRMVDYAVRLMWHRTGADENAFAPRRTHAESLDFIGRHPKLLQAVSHIIHEDKGDGVSKVYSPGYAAALLYLMATGRTDGDDYRNADPAPSETVCDLELWDKACDFWVLFAQANPEFNNIRAAIAGLYDPDKGSMGSLKEKTAIICKGWHLFAAGKKITPAGLRLEYVEDEEGYRDLVNVPDFGGIDQGEGSNGSPTPETPKKAKEAKPEPVPVETPAVVPPAPKGRKKEPNGRLAVPVPTSAGERK